ncbi:hypothetical protein CALVIDRAFT_553952 [Calocera viscosa TUFC12733]|uniref:Uncharacterized protein n=1 Tax=Calocera viscosa (strain TUFC12733) TaxID=1330018 RepID=A0A167P096_CALVF|nr:hypothetical protein CALVIDRAFT_553952 [Calocera viscosa TUFC12733]
MPQSPVQRIKNGKRGYGNPLFCLECERKRYMGLDTRIQGSLGACEHYRLCPSKLHISASLNWVILLDEEGNGKCDKPGCTWFYDTFRPYFSIGGCVYHPSHMPRIIAIKCTNENRIERYHQNREGILLLVAVVHGSRVWSEESPWIFAEVDGKPLLPEQPLPSEKKSRRQLIEHYMGSEMA